MNEERIQSLRDIILRRELTAVEERVVVDFLARRPDQAADWQVERVLGRALRALPSAAVPSNFTSRVLARIQREASPSQRSDPWTLFVRRWSWRRLGTVTALVAVLAAALAGWSIYRERSQADDLRQVAALRALAGMPPAVLEDFEAIRRFGDSAPPIDDELLAALQ